MFEDKRFERGPRFKNACPILVLRQSSGAFAGLVQLMRNETINEDMQCELIALSTGSASPTDLRRSLEWRIFEKWEDNYQEGNNLSNILYETKANRLNGEHALLANLTTAFHDDAATNLPAWDLFEPRFAEMKRIGDEAGVENNANANIQGPDKENLDWAKWFKARSNLIGRNREAGDSEDSGITEEDDGVLTIVDEVTEYDYNDFSTYSDSDIDNDNDDDETDHGSILHFDDAAGAWCHLRCHFYNVLWIERKDGIAYRRACGNQVGVSEI